MRRARAGIGRVARSSERDVLRDGGGLHRLEGCLWRREVAAPVVVKSTVVRGEPQLVQRHVTLLAFPLAPRFAVTREQRLTKAAYRRVDARAQICGRSKLETRRDGRDRAEQAKLEEATRAGSILHCRSRHEILPRRQDEGPLLRGVEEHIRPAHGAANDLASCRPRAVASALLHPANHLVVVHEIAERTRCTELARCIAARRRDLEGREGGQHSLLGLQCIATHGRVVAGSDVPLQENDQRQGRRVVANNGGEARAARASVRLLCARIVLRDICVAAQRIRPAG
eukprot:1774350-Prymnesium_polylepis.3